MQEIVKKNQISYIHIAVMLLLTFGIGFLSPMGQITPVGMKVLGVFLGTVYGWIFIDLFWVSLFGFFTLSLSGAIGLLPAFSSAFGNSTVIMTVVMMAFADCLNRIGISEAVAYWAISRKIFFGRPWLLCTSLLSVATLCGMFGCAYAIIFLLWTVVDRIAEINHIPTSSLFVSMMYCLILYAAMTGSTLVPFMPGFLMFAGFFTNATGLTVHGGLFLVNGIIYTFLSFAAMLLFSRFVLKANAQAFMITEELRIEYAARRMNTVQKVGLGLLAVYMTALILSTFLQGSIWSVITAWGVVGLSILYMSVFYIWKNNETGEAICDPTTSFSKGIMWPSAMLLMFTIPLSAAMESSEVGILATVSTVCAPIFNGLGVIPMLILIIVILGALTQVLHNMVVGAIFIPLLAPIMISMGCNPFVFFIAIYFTLQCAYLTPAASMMAGVIFGKSNISVKLVYLFGGLFFVASCLVLIITIPLSYILFSGAI